MKTVLLHGFWSQPADWNAVVERLPLHASLYIPDLYQPGPLAPHHSLQEWVTHFLDEVRAQGEGPWQVVGYSMGARLALNAIAADTSLFTRALLISGMPWLELAEHAAREQWEMTWRDRFHTQPWQELASAWQDQPVFSTDQPRVSRRQGGDQLRVMLGQSLLNWSPRHHRLDGATVRALPKGVDWAYGALDQKYLSVAKSLQELPVQGQISVIPNAGHRIPFDAPEHIAKWIGASS